jgi:translation initiation factor 3 subunit E
MADAAVSANQVDLIPRMTPFLDRHLVLPLLEFLEEKQIYPQDDIKRAKLELLAGTNMVDFIEDTQKSLGSSTNTQELAARKEEVMTKMNQLQVEANSLIELLNKPDTLKALKEAGNLNKLAYLSEHHGVSEGAVKALYALAKCTFECGVYEQANKYLSLVREVSVESEVLQNALWGKLATSILMETWDVALRDLFAIRDTIEARAFSNPTGQLQQRAWLLHWALPIFFNSPDSRMPLLDFFHHERTWQVIQIACPHLLRYIIAGSIVTKRRFPKEIVKMVDQESYTYSDPVTKFVEALYGQTDFETAETHLAQCGPLFDQDPFLHLVKDLFLENCRSLIFELFCKLHNCIDTQLLASKLNVSNEKSEEWIVQLIRTSKLDAKIDTQAHQILIGSQSLPLYQQLIDRTRPLIRPLGPIGPSNRRSHRGGHSEHSQRSDNRSDAPRPSTQASE